MFDKILIANRGEIACRVARTARRMGIRTVAVYSDADARSLHVALADEAFHIGGAAAAESYLRADRIIETAKRSGAQAVHPGYGFLSENADFAERCERGGVTFIGPPAAAIASMGDKAAAKAIMERAGVPVVPGYHGADQAEGLLAREAARIGYPVLLKASAGGGGKGMRVAGEAGAFQAALAACRREARSAFGDERVLIEKYLERPRHIEVQVFADRQGHCLHLFERDCSVQRRHQKILEEAPAPGMTEERRSRMGEAALAAAQAVGYVGAGTVEFIVDRAGTFYFMEMNTRLQVEHPVTEMITGLDLVEWQLRVAAGEPLPLAQRDLRIEGHAFEARVCAEDPSRDFLPAAGHLVHLGLPAESENVRVDAGVRPGDEVTSHYDTMIAKLIVRGRDREQALSLLRSALVEFEIAGIETNLALLLRIARSRAFAEADLDTGFIERRRAELLAPPAPPGEDVLALVTMAVLQEVAGGARKRALASTDAFSPWVFPDGWRIIGNDRQAFRFHGSGWISEVVVRNRGAAWQAEILGKRSMLAGRGAEGSRLRVELNGAEIAGRVIHSSGRYEVFTNGEHHVLELDDPLALEFDVHSHAGALAAPMPGRIAAVLVAPGAVVEKGAPLLVLEAMKMEHTIAAPFAGQVARICFEVGDQVEEGAALVVFDGEGEQR